MKTLFNFLKKLLLTLLVIIGIGVILIYATDNQYIFRGIKLTYLKGNTTANIDDKLDFDTRKIENGEVQEWKLSTNYNQISLTETLKKEIEDYNSAAFLVIKEGEILTEQYYNGYSDTSLTNSFSVSKTFITLLLGKAIEEGYVESLSQPITDFLPEFLDDSLARKCTVGDLSAMTAGYDWSEHYYLPLNPTAKAYYGRDIVDQMLSRGFVKESGEEFEYLSGVTQLLGIVVSRATNQTLSKYLSDKLWKPLGMRKESYWALDDKDGMEKAYCCVYSNARDFAKIGQLILQDGKWNGNQLIDSSFVALMKTPNAKAFLPVEPVKYGYSLWIDNEHETNFYALLGHLGQRVICIPSEDIVIVRLGQGKDQRSNKNGVLPGNDIYYYVEEVMKMIGEK